MKEVTLTRLTTCSQHKIAAVFGNAVPIKMITTEKELAKRIFAVNK